MGKRIAFHHFGCKVNFSEASSISREFREKGWELTDHHDEADIYVISTCAVTREAEKKCIYAIRQARRRNPQAKVAVIGCFSELSPEELRQTEGVSLVLGQSEKFRLLELIGDGDYHGAAIPEPQKEFIPSYSLGDRTRSFLKIQDGCDYYCTYCTIPFARGRSRSDTIAHVISEAKEIAASGIREIVLTGVNIGDFGRQNGESFLQLVTSLEEQVEIPRVRISSIEPDLLNDGIIRLAARSAKFLPHFHIPLQSGSDRVLRSMHRKYTRTLYASRVQEIRRTIPHACIAADVIVGFPGETDEDFQETFRFLEELPVSYMHVFSYSKRDRTLAAKMDNPVPQPVIKVRSERLHLLSAEKKRHFYRENEGRRVHVLFESDNSGGYMHGFSENYLKVRTPFDPAFMNRIVEAELGVPDDEPQFTYIP
jgi:threonylcarbamoyladenosine tRNA methylthiotransferase MtaB